MPLPSTGYLTTTIATAPGSAITDFSWLVDLSQFSGVTAFWTACTSSVGLKLRCALDSDETELPFDVWGFDNTGAEGYLRIKVPSFTGTQTLRIYPSDSGNADYATPTNAYDSNWVGYWPLDADVNDRTSNNNDGTASAGVASSVGAVGDGRAIGSGEKIDLSPATLTNSQISILMWARTNDLSLTSCSFFGSASGAEVVFRSGSGVGGKVNFILNSFSTNDRVSSATSFPTDDSWHHVGGVYDGTNLIAYYDGANDGSVTPTGSWGSLSAAQIGNWNAANSWLGDIDEVQLHSTGRSAVWLAQEHSQADDNAAFWGAGTWNAASGNTLTADTGTFALTGHAVSLPVTRTLTAAEGTFALTGHAALFPVTRTLTAATGEFTLTGHAATLPVTRKLTAAEGTFALTGHAALFPVTRKLAAATGEFTLTGNDATLTPVVGNTLVATRGQFALTGNDAAFSVTRSVTATTGEFTLTGIDTAFSVTRNLAAATGTFALTGHDASIALVAPNVLTAESGAFTYTGYSATLQLNDAPLTVNYYTQFYYMLLTGNNPYDALELPFGVVGAETLVGDGSLVG